MLHHAIFFARARFLNRALLWSHERNLLEAGLSFLSPAAEDSSSFKRPRLIGLFYVLHLMEVKQAACLPASENNSSKCIVCSRFDARDKSLLTYASHFSPIYGQRASMRLPNGLTSSKNVAVLVLSHLRPDDEGIYKCRADFKRSPTKNNRMFLSVLRKYLPHAGHQRHV